MNFGEVLRSDVNKLTAFFITAADKPVLSSQF